MSDLNLFVPGLPRPQGSMRAFVAAGRAHMRHSNHDDLAVWRGAVTQAALYAWGDTPRLDEPCCVSLAFYLPRPATAKPKRRPWPDRRPDLDKLTRAVLDSLTGVVLVDDARVVVLVATKHYADDEPVGARIYVAPTSHDPGPGPRRALEASLGQVLPQRGSSAVGSQMTPAGAGNPEGQS